MSGLENIVKEIEKEATAEAKGIRAKSKKEADAYLAETEKLTAIEAKEIEEIANGKAEVLRSSRISAVEQQHRQSVLKARQGVLRETLQKALEALYELPNEDYFALCKRLAVFYAEEGAGALLFNADDLARLPSGFEKELNAELLEGKSIQVSSEVAPIDGGFVLRYGFVEQNCSFAALFDARQEEFTDYITPILFADR